MAEQSLDKASFSQVRRKRGVVKPAPVVPAVTPVAEALELQRSAAQQQSVSAPDRRSRRLALQQSGGECSVSSQDKSPMQTALKSLHRSIKNEAKIHAPSESKTRSKNKPQAKVEQAQKASDGESWKCELSASKPTRKTRSRSKAPAGASIEEATITAATIIEEKTDEAEPNCSNGSGETADEGKKPKSKVKANARAQRKARAERLSGSTEVVYPSPEKRTTRAQLEQVHQTIVTQEQEAVYEKLRHKLSIKCDKEALQSPPAAEDTSGSSDASRCWLWEDVNQVLKRYAATPV